MRSQSVEDVLALSPNEEANMTEQQRGYHKAIRTLAAVAIHSYRREEVPHEWTDSVVVMCKAMRDEFLTLEDLK